MPPFFHYTIIYIFQQTIHSINHLTFDIRYVRIEMEVHTMEKILLDTDIGGDIDDAICLAYLLKEPQCDLLGITTVCGESETRASVADAICKAAGKKIPIVAGMDTTLQPIPLYPTPGGAEALSNWPHQHYQKEDAALFLYQKIKQHPH